MNVVAVIGKRFGRQVDQVIVVREQDDLGGGGEFREHLQCRCGAAIVELDQAIVDDQRDCIGVGQLVF